MSTPVWSSRTGAGLDDAFATFSSSIAEDAAFLEHDIIGSIAHVKGLAHAGLLNDIEAQKLIIALQGILSDAQSGAWSLDPALEDVHMNIEAEVTKRTGEVGKKIHTGRSRNDQVATCITLYSRQAMDDLAKGLLSIAHALAAQASKYQATPWVARTHGQPAQPATLGFLLAGHAWRFADAAQHVLWTARQTAISPLGSGAVAGSTLPIDPVHTAHTLGLAPPRNALLATGSRDTILAVLRLTTQIGVVASGLAEDLFQLTSKGAVTYAPGLMSGSSLMPQKRNPDAVELVRGHARALLGHEQAALAVCAPLGLGYVRDLQVTKPMLLAATTQADALLGILQACIESMTVKSDILAAELSIPGIGATDAAEALVATGMPFRDAYKLLAEAHAGEDPVAFLEGAALPLHVKQAAIQALGGDVEKRDTTGGPAPQAVQASMQHLDVVLATLEAQQAALHTSVTEAQKVIEVISSPS